MLSRAITGQLKEVEKLQARSLPSAVVMGQNDADTILEILRKIISLCDVFQVSHYLRKPYTRRLMTSFKMDTQLNTEATAVDILQVRLLLLEA
jgi:hypothetical protein